MLSPFARDYPQDLGVARALFEYAENALTRWVDIGLAVSWVRLPRAAAQAIEHSVIRALDPIFNEAGIQRVDDAAEWWDRHFRSRTTDHWCLWWYESAWRQWAFANEQLVRSTRSACRWTATGGSSNGASAGRTPANCRTFRRAARGWSWPG